MSPYLLHENKIDGNIIMSNVVIRSLVACFALNGVFGAVAVINPQEQVRIELAIQRSIQTYEEDMNARREDEAKLLKAIEASLKKEVLRQEAEEIAEKDFQKRLLLALALSTVTAAEDRAKAELKSKKEAIKAIDMDYIVPALSDFTVAASAVSDIEHTSDNGDRVYRKLSLRDNGLCGFYALGITQAEYVKMLNDKLRSLEKMDDKSNYWVMRAQIEGAINDERTVRDPSTRNLVDLFDSSITEVTATVEKWVMEEYAYLEVGLLPWINDQLPFSICVWEETKKIGGPLSLALQLESNHAHEVRHLLKSQKHFDLLLPKLFDCVEDPS